MHLEAQYASDACSAAPARAPEADEGGGRRESAMSRTGGSAFASARVIPK